MRTIEAHAGELDLLVFSSDGARLTTSGASDGKVHIWRVADGARLATFPVRKNSPHMWEEPAVAVTSDGRRLAALTDANTIKVWDVDGADRDR